MRFTSPARTCGSTRWVSFHSRNFLLSNFQPRCGVPCSRPWWLASVVVGVCGLIAHFSLAKALKLAPATVVMPLDFMRLPLIAMVGFLLYDEPLLLSVFAGSALIFYANWLNVRAEQKAQAASPTP